MTEEQKFHYFDWASTSPSDNKILQEALEISQSAWANPSSIHAGGKEARTILESSREKCASVLGVKAEQIYFTSGGTESNHIPLLSVLNRPKKGTVLLSSIEHPANREMASSLQKCGWKTVFIPSSSDGIITPESVEKCLSDDTVFVSIMAVNNETGAIQPVYEIAELLKKFYSGKRKPKFHIDCVQAAGKIPLNISADGIDSAAFSAHKISGPRGIGILYLKETISLLDSILLTYSTNIESLSNTFTIFLFTTNIQLFLNSLLYCIKISFILSLSIQILLILILVNLMNYVYIFII